MDEVPDDVFMFVLGDIGIALGEHDYAGRGTPTSHRLSYEIPYLIRHPRGEKAGDDIDWYATTHDVAPTLLSTMGLTIPGKMRGEDLTQLLTASTQGDLPERPFSITRSGSLIIVRDKRWLMVADREQIERRLYDDDEEADDDDQERYDDVAADDPGQLTDMSLAALTVAGGTLPEFGSRRRRGRRASAATTTSTTTASPTTGTRSTTSTPTTSTGRSSSSGTAATPRTAPGHARAAPMTEATEERAATRRPSSSTRTSGGSSA